jgi:hypothetical protein
MRIVKLLPHQTAFIQAPYVFPEARFFFLIAGYAAGKTSSLVYAVLKLIDYYSGKVDEEGNPPKIGVCGITLTFLKKTFSGALVTALRQSKSIYNYDKAHNIIYVAGVELHLTPIANEEDMFGFNWCIGSQEPIQTRNGLVPIQNIRVGDEVLTRQGYKKVMAVMYKGYKPVHRLTAEDGNNVLLTKDHRVFTQENDFIEAQHLTSSMTLVTINQGEQRWQENRVGTSEAKSLTLMVKDTTDTQTHQSMEEGHTSTRQTMKHCTKQCGNTITERFQTGTQSITEMVTPATTTSRISCFLQSLSTRLYIMLNGLTSAEQSKSMQCEKHSRYEPSNSDRGKSLQSPEKTKRSASTNVSRAARHSLQQAEPMQSTAAPHASQSLDEYEDSKQQLKNTKVSSISSELRYEHVYDIEVEDAHEFFAGGILVHNCAAVIDELDELPTYTAVAIVKSINDRCRQVVKGARPPFLAFATTSQGLKGTYQVVMNFVRKGINHIIIRARTKDNIHLPKEYVESQYAIYNEKEQQCLLEGKFISIDSGLVYPDYDPSHNRLETSLYDTVLPNETIYIGQDFNVGFNKAVACIARDGVLYAIKEYSFPDIRRAPEVFRYDFRFNRIKWVPDATYNHHLPEFKKELRSNRIEVIYRTKNPLVKDRAFLINKMLYSRRLYIAGDCKELDNALVIRQIDKNTGAPAKGKGEGAPDHISDCIEYVASYCTSWLKEFRDLYKVTLGRRIDKRVEAGLTTEDAEKYSEDVENATFEELSLQ